jgi:hypothetical protein
MAAMALRRLQTILLFCLLVLPLPARAQLNTAVTATDLAISMGIPAGIIISAELLSTGANPADPRGYAVHTGALGAFSPTEGGTFAIITCDDVNEIPGSNDVPGQSYDQNVQDGRGLDNGGDDIVKLRVVINPPDTAGSFAFDFAFLSEEYPEFVGSSFNDFFMLEKDASNISVDSNAQATSPYNVVYDQSGKIISINANFFKDNTNQNTGTEYDGWTPILTTCAPIVGTDSLVLTFSIADMGDAILGSAVYLDNFVFYTGTGTPLTYFAGSKQVLGGDKRKLDIIAYPNPFLPNQGGRVTIELASDQCPCILGVNGLERVEIYDISGRRVHTLVGITGQNVTWDGRNVHGAPVGSGTYFYAGHTTDGKWGSGKFTLVR